VSSYGTGIKSDEDILKIVKDNFDLRPGALVIALNLKKPIYQQTASYGHFGRSDFTWEQPKKIIF